MATCVCGAPVLHMRGSDEVIVVVEQHEQAGAGPGRYIERAGRLVPVTLSWEGSAYVRHSCPRGSNATAAHTKRSAP